MNGNMIGWTPGDTARIACDGLRDALAASGIKAECDSYEDGDVALYFTGGPDAVADVLQQGVMGSDPEFIDRSQSACVTLSKIPEEDVAAREEALREGWVWWCHPHLVRHPFIPGSRIVVWDMQAVMKAEDAATLAANINSYRSGVR